MLRSIRQTALWGWAALLCLMVLGIDIAHAYPDQPIKIIVTFPPGGSADIVIRALQPLVAADLQQPIVIENRSGAGGNIGIAAVAQAVAHAEELHGLRPDQRLLTRRELEEFVDEVLASTAGKKLKALADRWYGDGRPFARRALLRYPAMSMQIVARIYAQALRLRLKGAHIHPHPTGERPKGFLSP